MTPLRQRMLEDMQIRKWSPLTQRAYVSAASLVVAVAALRFLYTVTLQKTWSVEAVILVGQLTNTLT